MGEGQIAIHAAKGIHLLQIGGSNASFFFQHPPRGVVRGFLRANQGARECVPVFKLRHLCVHQTHAKLVVDKRKSDHINGERSKFDITGKYSVDYTLVRACGKVC